MKTSGSAVPETGALMDLLDDVGVSPAVAPSVGVTPATPTAFKRGVSDLSLCSDETLEPFGKRVKEEPTDDDVGASSAQGTPRKPKAARTDAGSPGSSVGGSPASKKANADQCAGCGRVANQSPDFLIVGEVCAWAFPNGRGHWCQQCHRVHQSNFQQSHALAYFPQWLSDPENRKVWEETLLADLSLRWEGVGKVTGDMVTKRVSVLKWLWGVIGKDPIRSAGTEGFIRHWLSQLAGAPPAEKGLTDVKDEVGESPAPKKSSLAKNLDGLIPKAKELMDKFSSEAWPTEISDGNLTKPTDRLAALYSQCCSVGEERHVTELASTWSDGVQSAKQFLKALIFLVCVSHRMYW